MSYCRNEGAAEEPSPPCPLHSFVLSPLDPSAFFKRPIQLNLCPLPLQNTSTYYSIIPHFNHDNKDFTPGFILDFEKPHFQKNYQQIQKQFKSREDREQGEHSKELRLPKPFNARKFCYICRVAYVDYLEHTNHKAHLHKLKTNRYRNMIAHLCRDHYPGDYVEKTRRGRMGYHKYKRLGSRGDEGVGENGEEEGSEGEVEKVEVKERKREKQGEREEKRKVIEDRFRMQEVSRGEPFSPTEAHNLNSFS